MSRVFVSEATRAVIHVLADDHCPPHVHARHRGEEWIARVGFSYISAAVALISIAPLRNVPSQRAVNRLLDDIAARLTDCRRAWWMIRRTTCLENQWAVAREGRIELRSGRTRDAKQVIEAGYDPETERLHVIFRDRTTAEVSTRP